MKQLGEKLFPEQSDLVIEDGVSFRCFKCNQQFSSEKVQTEKMTKNFHVAGLKDESEIPKCPHCGAVAFFGFERVEKNGKSS